MSDTFLDSMNTKQDKNTDLRIEEDIAHSILDLLFKNRKLVQEQDDSEYDAIQERELHLKKIRTYMSNNESIHMILPAFPVKSPNREKTLSYLPDYAEQHAFKVLNTLCEEIKSIYPPGASISICSDGRVFSDLLTIPDYQVTEYGTTLRNMVDKDHPGVFSFFNLEDVYHNISCFETMREEMMVSYGESMSDLIYRTKNNPHAKSMYLGITRFILEDYSGIAPFREQTRTAVQKISKKVSYRVILRSNAWSRLLKDKFPDAVRLSIHPQFRTSEKIGVYLGEAHSAWTTPWHSVAVLREGKVHFEKRAEIESKPNIMLAYVNGRPSHFIDQSAASNSNLTEKMESVANEY